MRALSFLAQAAAFTAAFIVAFCVTRARSERGHHGVL